MEGAQIAVIIIRTEYLAVRSVAIANIQMIARLVGLNRAISMIRSLE